jgi:hypothetical protein
MNVPNLFYSVVVLETIMDSRGLILPPACPAPPIVGNVLRYVMPHHVTLLKTAGANGYVQVMSYSTFLLLNYKT